MLEWTAAARSALGCVLLLGLPCLAHSAPPITVSVQVTDDGSHPSLEFVLESHAERELRLPGELLPWRSSRYTTLVLLDPRGGGRLLEDRYAVLPGVTGGEVVTIAAKGSIRGRVSLSERYPELTSLRAETDVVVFWSYQPAVLGPPDDRKALAIPRVAGALILRRFE